jgi:hypothetical protein
MFKSYLALLLIVIAACNTNSNNSATVDSTKVAAPGKSFTWSDEDEKEFLADCVQNAKASRSDTTAYAQCKCVLDQLKQNFPSLDSADNALADSSKAAVYVSKCK